ncbi:protein germ cell-less [Nilaparvata lugens]|uniref:protein germ cell-less n=1 Tax=Nilaparvata lugens TaxID=108931 RepID=UPI00193D89C2|nr:protein germ cell-less [Nilaparvata lugens]
MGGTFSRLNYSDRIKNYLSSNRKKRKLEECDDEEFFGQYMNPKKRKMVCTAKYIYKALFLDGQEYDIIVDVLDKEWKLHKIYLQQSPYFASMFSGSWNETNKSYVKIEVPDPNVTLEALTVLFGSLYPSDEVTLEPCNIVAVLAAATLFQCEGLIDQCADVMLQTISPLTAVNYYNAACQYNLTEVKQKTLKFFNINLINYFQEHADRLRHIGEDLMAELVNSKDLCVVQMEFSLYLMLRHWMFLRLHPDTVSSNPDRPDHSYEENYFKERSLDEPEFLLTEEGNQFVRIFRGLRLEHVIIHVEDFNNIIEDRIIPHTWLYPTLVSLWHQVLHNENMTESDSLDVAEDVFYAKCMRLGRVVVSKEPAISWRWNGFMMGLNLVWCLTPQYLSVKRHRQQVMPNTFARNLVCRITVISQDQQKQVTAEQCSGIVKFSLVRFEEVQVMDLTKDLTYPITISISLLISTPNSKPALPPISTITIEQPPPAPVSTASLTA